MIYDGFMFFNEFDLLEIRLNEMSPVVDRFILVEADHTIQGKPKPYYFDQNKDRFSKWDGRIIHVKVDDLPNTGSWENEYHQRNAILRGVADPKEDDFLIVSDVDEIIRWQSVLIAKATNSIACLVMSLHYYYLNLAATSGCCWSLPKMVPMRLFMDRQLESTQKLRCGTKVNTVVNDAGWHFSYMGGIDSIIQKIESFSHAECNNDRWKNRERIQRMIDSGTDLYERDLGYTFQKVPMDTLPKHVQENQDKFAHLLLK